MKHLISSVLFLVASISSVAFAQDDRIIPGLEGMRMPDYNFINVTNYVNKATSIKEKRGKWLVLDFWDKGCTACIAGFPHMNKLQEQYKDKFEFLLVGMEYDKAGEIQALYERCRKKWSLKIPCAFDSGKLFDMLFANTPGVPKVCIVDPDGIIRYAANGSVQGKDLDQLYASKGVKQIKADNVATTTIFKSSISLSSGKFGRPELITSSAKPGDLLIGSSRLTSLYFFAFLGSESPYRSVNPQSKDRWKRDEFFQNAVLEVADSSLFKYDFQTLKNLFDYTLQVPVSKASRENLMLYMQQDLKRYFGYEASIEQRKLPYLRLVATKQAREKLRAKGDSTYSYASKSGVTRFKNQPVKNTILSIAEEKLAVVDETGITGNIDLAFTIIPTDFEDYRRALRENGLDLVKGEKLMYCLVIRDPKPSATK